MHHGCATLATPARHPLLDYGAQRGGGALPGARGARRLPRYATTTAFHACRAYTGAALAVQPYRKHHDQRTRGRSVSCGWGARAVAATSTRSGDGGGDWLTRAQTAVRGYIDPFRRDSEGRLLLWLVGVNGCVYAAWQVARRGGARAAPLLRLLRAHALQSNAGLRRGRVHTLITSAFSHMGIIHLGVNMFVLCEFGSRVMACAAVPRQPQRLSHPRIDASSFAAMYASSCVGGGLAAALFHAATRTPHVLSLGASGGVLGVLTYYLAMAPDSRVAVMGGERQAASANSSDVSLTRCNGSTLRILQVPMSATTALQVNIAVNLLGMLFLRSVPVGWAAHLGGTVVGLAWQQFHASQFRRTLRRKRSRA